MFRTAILCALIGTAVLEAEPVPVRHAEGLIRGFLILRSLDGDAIADGDLIQNVRGDRVTSRLVFHFKDGSLHDETVVIRQHGSFRLISDHLVQKGRTFPQPLDMTIDAAAGRVTVRYADKDGAEKVESKEMEIPADLANGSLPILLKNISPDAPPRSVSLIAATPSPRLVKLEITPAGEERFSTAGAAHRATHYVVKVDIGGLAGFFAPLVGKQPPDSHVWIMQGDAPAFVKSEQPLYLGGPVWRIELVSPVWPKRESTLRSR